MNLHNHVVNDRRILRFWSCNLCTGYFLSHQHILSDLRRFTQIVLKFKNLAKLVAVFGLIGDKICWSDKEQPVPVHEVAKKKVQNVLKMSLNLNPHNYFGLRTKWNVLRIECTKGQTSFEIHILILQELISKFCTHTSTFYFLFKD